MAPAAAHAKDVEEFIPKGLSLRFLGAFSLPFAGEFGSAVFDLVPGKRHRSETTGTPGKGQLLAEIGVSSQPLARLILAAQEAGSFGAKLSGGGRGGNIIALVDPANPQPVLDALTAAGAKRVILTSVGEGQ